MVSSQSKFIESSRTHAREIKTRMQKAGTPVTLQQAYELLAKESGYRTWAAMKTSMLSAEKAKSSTEPSASMTVGKTMFLIDELRRKAAEDFAETMGDKGYNPASVSAGVAYDIAEALTVAQINEAFSDAPDLAEIDTGDKENQSFFGTPKTAVDAMRFAITVDLMEQIDLRPYAKLVEAYGHTPTVARLREQQRPRTWKSEDLSILIDGVSYPGSRVGWS